LEQAGIERYGLERYFWKSLARAKALTGQKDACDAIDAQSE
jgi:hypothetical protein